MDCADQLVSGDSDIVDLTGTTETTESCALGALLFMSGGWRHLSQQADIRIAERLSIASAEQHRLPLHVQADITPFAPSELASLHAAFPSRGSMAIGGFLSGGEFLTIGESSQLQTYSNLLLIFRSLSRTGF